MARLDHLLANYRRYVALPRQPHLPLSQRIWFLVYPLEDERRLTNRLTEFELATRDAGLVWQRLDLTGAVADWLDTFDDIGRRKRPVWPIPKLSRTTPVPVSGIFCVRGSRPA